MTVLKLQSQIDAPADIVFDLARSVDAHLESASRTEERAVGGVTSGLLELGDEVTWEARHFGLRFRLTSRITELDRPHHFRDTMVHGPFGRMHHDHFFESMNDGRTRMRDRFDYSMPWGVLGHLADIVAVRRHLRHFLDERNRYLRVVAEEITGASARRASG